MSFVIDIVEVMHLRKRCRITIALEIILRTLFGLRTASLRFDGSMEIPRQVFVLLL